MEITEVQIKNIGNTIPSQRILLFLPWINKYAAEYGVNTVLRMAAFLAQLMHESGGFKYVQELASGEAYELRKDLGNVLIGDGKKFKGRGLIQITGRANYEKVSMALFGDGRLLETPALLETPELAVRSAYWYWSTHHLNEQADDKNFEMITRRINGGLNGLADRKYYYTLALKALGDGKS